MQGEAMTVTSLVVTQCDQCGQYDDHPKVHSFDGGTRHHDCVSHVERLDILAGTHSQHPLITAKIFDACITQGVKGQDLREFIGGLHMQDFGAAQMATTGIDQGMANTILTALTPTAGTYTIGTATITAPVKCRFDSAMTTTDTGASTEWATSGGYTAGGVSVGANWATATGGTRATNGAVTVTNAPAQTWAGNELWDSSATPLRSFWGTLATSKTVNVGDTCTIGSGSLSASLG
jgi:hypothetical protein